MATVGVKGLKHDSVIQVAQVGSLAVSSKQVDTQYASTDLLWITVQSESVDVVDRSDRRDSTLRPDADRVQVARVSAVTDEERSRRLTAQTSLGVGGGQFGDVELTVVELTTVGHQSLFVVLRRV